MESLMLSFRACNNFLFYQHARLKLKAYLAYLHIHNMLLLCRFCNVTLRLQGEETQKQISIMTGQNLQYFSNCLIYICLFRPRVCTITDQTNLLPAPTVMFWLKHFSFRSVFLIHKLNCSTICNCLVLHAVQVGRIIDEYSREKRKKT